MNLIKMFTLALLMGLPISDALADAFIDKVMNQINVCYDQFDLVDNELSECVIAKIKTEPNVNKYYIKVEASEEQKGDTNQMKILFYNAAGNITYCTGIAGKKLTIKTCVSSKGNPLDLNKALSVTLP